MPKQPTHVVTNTNLKIEVPPWWTITVSAVSRRDYKQLVRMQESIYSHTVKLQSRLGKSNDVMTNTFSGEDSWAMVGQDQKSTLDFNFYFSLDKTVTHRQITNDKYLSNKIHVITTSKPATASKAVPDYVTFLAFIEDAPNSQVVGVGQYADAVLAVHCVKGPDDPTNPNEKPPPPPPDTNPGYNDVLDRKRPSTIQNYLKSYDTVFLIDDSGSMAGQKWQECCNALIGIAQKAIDYDTDGIDIYYLNSTNVIKVNVKDISTVQAAINNVQPSGGTPTGAKVKERLSAHMDILDKAVNKPEYAEIKPLDLIVITDGVPTDDPKVVLIDAAARLKNAKHHPNAIGIQFVQIGNDAGADVALRELASLQVNGMVDTVPYKSSLTPAELERILLGGLHPNIRALHQQHP